MTRASFVPSRGAEGADAAPAAMRAASKPGAGSATSVAAAIPLGSVSSSASASTAMALRPAAVSFSAKDRPASSSRRQIAVPGLPLISLTSPRAMSFSPSFNAAPAEPARQSPVDRRRQNRRRNKGQREIHANGALAPALADGEGFDGLGRMSREFVEPAMSPANRLKAPMALPHPHRSGDGGSLPLDLDDLPANARRWSRPGDGHKAILALDGEGVVESDLDLLRADDHPFDRATPCFAGRTRAGRRAGGIDRPAGKVEL